MYRGAMVFRPSPEQIAKRKREIAKRYARKASRSFNKKPRTMAALRMADLTKLFDHRFGKMHVPESDAGLEAARIAAHHLGALTDAPRRISSWITTCAPWLPMPERERLISEVTEHRLRWSADKLGWKLKLTDEERSGLHITTIGAIDCNKDQRKAKRKQHRSERDKLRRPKVPKSAKPWNVTGISRAHWYRIGKPRPRV
jgi:hypothetical protein